MISKIAESILTAGLLSAIFLAAALILRKLLSKNLSYSVLSFIWIVVLIRLLMPFTLDSPVNFGGLLNIIPKTIDTMAEVPVAEQNYAVGQIMSPTSTAYPEDYPQTFSQPDVENTSINPNINRINWVNLSLFIWLAGVLYVLTKNGIRMAVFKRQAMSQEECLDGEILKIVDKYRKELNISGWVRIKECKYTRIPVIMGAVHPVMLMPAGILKTMDKKSISMIILHEMCHIKLGDTFKNNLWLIAKALNWYNPLAWIGYKAFLDDTEKACDAAVLSYIESSQRADYLDALLAAAKLVVPFRNAPAVLCFAGDKSKLRKRVETMIKNKKPKMSVNIIAALLIAILSLACFTTACTDSDQANEHEYAIVETPMATPTPMPEDMGEYDNTPGILYYNGRTPASAEELAECDTIKLMNVDSLSFLEGMENIKTVMTTQYFEETITFDISVLSSLPNLQNIYLENSAVSGDIQALSSLENLRNVMLSRTEVTGDISAFANLMSLEQVYLSRTFTTGDIAVLKDKIYLTGFSFSETAVTGDIASFEKLARLRFLNLDETAVSGDIEVLANLTMLEQVYLGGTNTTGDIAAFAELPYVAYAGLEMTEAYGDVQVFAGCKDLHMLYIFATKIGGDITSLEDLKDLEQLQYEGSQVTGELIIPYPMPRG